MNPNAISILAASSATMASVGLTEVDEYLPTDKSPNGRSVPNGYPAIRGSRNKPCGCGSGLKFKKCCLKKPGAFN